MLALLGDFISGVTNWIRGLDTSIRSIIILGALVLSIFLFARCINVGKNHSEKPVKWVYFGISIILFGVAIVFAVV